MIVTSPVKALTNMVSFKGLCAKKEECVFGWRFKAGPVQLGARL